VRFWQLFLLAVESLRRARLRAALTTAGIAIACGALVSMISFALGLQREAERPIEELGLLNNIEVSEHQETDPEKPEPLRFDTDTLDRLEAIDGVEIAYPEFRKGGIFAVSENGRAEAIGMGVPQSPLLGSIFQRVLCAGTYFTGESELQAIPGDLLVEQLGFESPEKALGQTISLSIGKMGRASEGDENVEVCIVGVFQPPGMSWRLRPTAILLPTDLLRGVRRAKRGGAEGKGVSFRRITVRAEKPSEVDRIAREIEQLGFVADPIAESVENMLAFFLFLEALLAAIGAVGLIIAGLGILNTLLMTVLERTAEIGLYRSMGATTGEVRLIFLVEAGTLGFFGGLGGLVLARVVCSLLQMGIDYYMETQDRVFRPDAFLFSPGLLIGAVLFAVVVSVLSGVYPASRAAKVDPIRALRGE
jgi:ABC-type antimicrobial peptide transport system permease subunit